MSKQPTVLTSYTVMNISILPDGEVIPDEVFSTTVESSAISEFATRVRMLMKEYHIGEDDDELDEYVDEAVNDGRFTVCSTTIIMTTSTLHMPNNC